MSRRCGGCATSSRRAPKWFADLGKPGHPGVRSWSVSGRVKDPGVKLAPAGVTVRELIEQHCGGMAEGHEFKAYLPGGASGGILPASMADIPLDFGGELAKQGAFVGLACGGDILGQGQRQGSDDQPAEVLQPRKLRPVHAVPRGNGQDGVAVAEGRQLWTSRRCAIWRRSCAILRSAASVRPRPIRSITCWCISARTSEMTDKIEFTLDGKTVGARRGRDDLGRGQARRHAHPPSLPRRPARLPARRQLPRLHGRDRRRARAGRLVHPQAGRGHGGQDRYRARRRSRAKWCSSFWPATCGRPMPVPTTSRISGNGRRRWASPAASASPASSTATRRAEFDITESRHRRQSRRLHRLRRLRARLPRSAGQRRHRHGRSRRPLRSRCSTCTTRWACRPA